MRGEQNNRRGGGCGGVTGRQDAAGREDMLQDRSCARERGYGTRGGRWGPHSKYTTSNSLSLTRDSLQQQNNTHNSRFSPFSRCAHEHSPLRQHYSLGENRLANMFSGECSATSHCSLAAELCHDCASGLHYP